MDKEKLCGSSRLRRIIRTPHLLLYKMNKRKNRASFIYSGEKLIGRGRKVQILFRRVIQMFIGLASPPICSKLLFQNYIVFDLSNLSKIHLTLVDVATLF